MSKTPNKTLIGAFVVGALSLLFIAIAVFGSGKFFEKTTSFVLLFDGSISGLSVGSPVMFRGVPVGRVTDIQLAGNLQRMEFQTPVFIELNQQKSSRLFDSGNDEEVNSQDYLNKLVANGLRASLATQSFLTGQLMVELNFYPAEQLPKHLDVMAEYNGYPEIPTIPSKFDNALHKLSTLPIEEIAQNMLELSQGLRHLIVQANESNLVGNMNKLILELERVPESVDKTLTSIQHLSKAYTNLAHSTNQQLVDRSAEAAAMFRTINDTTKELERLIRSTQGVVNANSPTIIELNRALRELSEAAQAVRVFTNTLERHPEILLRGKQ